MDSALDLSLNEFYGLSTYTPKLIRLPLQAYVAYFAFLFVVLAWWRQAEVTRARRVSLWSVAWCGFVAWLLHFVWWFPQPLGLLLAAAIAFTIQLSSTWMPPSRRQELADIRAKHTALHAKLAATEDSTWTAVERDLEADWNILGTAFERWAAHVDQDFKRK